MRLDRVAVLTTVVLAVTPGLAHAGAVEFTNGLSTGAGPRGIAAGPGGNLWFTEANNGLQVICDAGAAWV